MFPVYSAREQGVSSIEILIVAAVLVIVAAVAVPKFIEARVAANERMAVDSLSAISAAQLRCSNRRFLDSDNDGVGEHVFLAPLVDDSGKTRTSRNDWIPPLLSGSFTYLEAGIAQRSGYLFEVYLPDKDGRGVDQKNQDGRLVDADQSERLWCAYAWPAHEDEGSEAFFVNQDRLILSTKNQVQRYFGTNLKPGSSAAYREPENMEAEIAIGQAGVDGGVWELVNPTKK